MTVALANALRKSFFAYTNNEKGHNLTRADRMERQVTSYCQDVSVATDTIGVLKGTTQGAKCVNSLSKTLNSSKSTSKLLEWTSTGAKWASKAVNPILCFASGARALSADDKKSAILKEGCAMGAMFGVEALIKNNLGLNGKSATYVNNKTLSGMADWGKKLLKSSKLLSKIPTNRLTGIIKAAIFVAGSCSAFAVGSKIGKTLADNTTAKQFEVKKLQKEQAQLQKLLAEQNKPVGVLS